MVSGTADSVRLMAADMNLTLSPGEAAGVTEIVELTGSHAPEAEVVARFLDGALTPGMLTYFVPWMWASRLDDSPVPTETWRAMFAEVHHTVNKRVVERPRRTVRAYRGATAANREGLSWSLDPGQARYFAASRQAPGATDARVWVANIPAERVFARFLDGWEKEVTADVRGLDIYPVEEERRLPRPYWWFVRARASSAWGG